MHKSINVLTLCFYLAEVIGLVTMDIAGWAREKRIRNLETVNSIFLGGHAVIWNRLEVGDLQGSEWA